MKRTQKYTKLSKIDEANKKDMKSKIKAVAL